MFIVDATLKCNFENRPEGPCTYCYNTSLRRKFQEQEITDIKGIEETLRKDYPKRQGSIILHGGEPLAMDDGSLEKLLGLSVELSGRSHIQTNGTLITDKKIELFKKYKTHVGVSIDGYWPANQWRGKSKETTDLVIKNIFKLKDAGVPVAVLITLHRDNAAPEKIKYVEDLILDLSKKGIPSKVNLIYHPDPKIEIPIQQAKLIYLRLAEFVLDNNLPDIRPFQSIINNLLGERSECMFQECDPLCTIATHVTSKGIPGLCGRFEQEVFCRENFPTSMRWDILKRTDCKDCRYGGKVCFGGCPAVAKDWDWRNKDRFCEVYYALFEFFEKKLKALLPFVPLKTEPAFKPFFPERRRLDTLRDGRNISRNLRQRPPENRPRETKAPSFPRIAWMGGGQDNAQMLQQWADEFNQAELLTVVHKLRDCGIYLMDAAKCREDCSELEKMGLVVLPIQKVGEVSSYVRCVISYSEERAKELLNCIRSGGQDCASRIGKLLGYPACCVDFLSKYPEGQDVIDPIFAAAKRTKGAVVTREKGSDGKGFPGKIEAETVSLNVPPETNVILRNFGVKAIPYIPCSFTCEKSREFSKKFLEFMPSKDNLLEFLKEPVTWDEYKGVAIINTKWFKGTDQSVFHGDGLHHIINFNQE